MMGAISLAALAFAVSGVIAWYFIARLEALQGIHRELAEANRLTRERWAGDYKEGRIEKPVRVRA